MYHACDLGQNCVKVVFYSHRRQHQTVWEQGCHYYSDVTPPAAALMKWCHPKEVWYTDSLHAPDMHSLMLIITGWILVKKSPDLPEVTLRSRALVSEPAIFSQTNCLSFSCSVYKMFIILVFQVEHLFSKQHL